MHRTLFALSLALSAAPTARALDVVWMSLAGQLAYRDAGTACTTDTTFSGELVMAMTVEKGEVTYVELRSGPVSLPMMTIHLSHPERRNLLAWGDAKGETWIREWTLSERTLAWIVNRMARVLCPLPQGLVTTGGERRFVFTPEALKPGQRTNASGKIEFQGTREDGKTYRASLVLLQRPYY